MEVSTGWFIALLGLSALAFAAGWKIGVATGRRTSVVVVIVLMLLAVWIWLQHHPAVAVFVLPPHVLRYMEGVAAAPLVVLILGIVWAKSQAAHHKRLAGLTVALTFVYFLTGGVWMLQTTPSIGFGQIAERRLKQSQEYSCVPAACAAVLNELGVAATEEEMAILTEVRPGTGASVIRAVDALRQRLDAHHKAAPRAPQYRVALVQTPAGQVANYPLPALTPLRLETTRRHMVVLLDVKQDMVHLFDPIEGFMLMDRPEFEKVYTGVLIVFVRDRR